MEGSEIEHFYDLLTQREEIDVIYDKYAVTEGQMSSKDLLNFLLNEQREQVTLHDAVRLIEKYEVDQTGRFQLGTRSSGGGCPGPYLRICLFFSTAKQRKHMTKDGFLMYLHQDEGCILNPAHKHIYQDMHQPLNHYFISSSHNTYLMEDQLKGPSSTEAYIR